MFHPTPWEVKAAMSIALGASFVAGVIVGLLF